MKALQEEKADRRAGTWGEEIPSQELHRRAVDKFKLQHPNATTGDLIWVNRFLEAEEAAENETPNWTGRAGIGMRREQRSRWVQ